MNENKALVVKGSIMSMSTRGNKTLAEAIVESELMCAVDVSGSMNTPDANDGQQRYAAACNELARIQSTFPGKVLIIPFSDKAYFEPSGFPPYMGSGTNMVAALEMLHMADDSGIKLVLISDGFPDNDEETLRMARKFRSPIHTVFIGVRGSAGHMFMEQLAKLTGGIADIHETRNMKALGGSLQKLLGTSLPENHA